MWALLKWIFIGHTHHWEIHKEGNIVDKDKAHVGSFYDCRCTVCGEMKLFSLRA
jgi:UDP-2,3-diacylglucosamine pyrophosphatase LpxH